MKYAHTGMTLHAAEDGHNHIVTDPGHNHEEDNLCHVKIMPAPDGHTHELWDLGHVHFNDEPAITGAHVEEVNGHSHQLIEYGHKHEE
jgi:hypothetical protein